MFLVTTCTRAAPSMLAKERHRTHNRSPHQKVGRLLLSPSPRVDFLRLAALGAKWANCPPKLVESRHQQLGHSRVRPRNELYL